MGDDSGRRKPLRGGARQRPARQARALENGKPIRRLRKGNRSLRRQSPCDLSGGEETLPGWLPPGHRFSVRVPLIDRDSGQREDTFVGVEKIERGQITGTIGNELLAVKNYKTGQRITFPESRIDNWLILRPDGTEEGNFVGKFLDHYKPR